MAGETVSLLIDPQEAADLALWQPYEAGGVAGVNTSELLLPAPDQLDAEWEAFNASNGVYVPDLRPRAVDFEALDAQERVALDYKDALRGIDADLDLKQAYRWRINEMIANARMVRAAATGDSSRFDRYNSFIYGKADKEIFGSAADTFCREAETQLNSPITEVRDAAANVLLQLHDYRGDASLIVPSDEVFQAVRDEHFRPGGYFALILSGVELPESGSITHETGGEAALEQVMHNLESDYTLAQASGKTWSLDHAHGQVKYPVDYKLPIARFIGLPVGHEVGSHLLERQNGERSSVRLLRNGLDRYEAGNEGRALIREQIAYPNFEKFAGQQRWQDIMRRQLATALAEGVTGQRMALPELYKVINAVDRLREFSKKPGDIEAAEKQADRRTRKLMESVYKGTDGAHGPYSRYRIYLEGNVASWHAAEQNPGIITKGDLGKYDITNPRHIQLLQKQGVLPKVK